MRLIKFFGSILSVLAAALIGNIVGDQLRADATGEPQHETRFLHTNETGETVIATNIVWSNFLPGVVVGLFNQPRWLWAFIGGLAASRLMGDLYEEDFMRWAKEYLDINP
jgi:hypothetical protein